MSTLKKVVGITQRDSVPYDLELSAPLHWRKGNWTLREAFAFQGIVISQSKYMPGPLDRSTL